MGCARKRRLHENFHAAPSAHGRHKSFEILAMADAFDPRACDNPTSSRHTYRQWASSIADDAAASVAHEALEAAAAEQATSRMREANERAPASWTSSSNFYEEQAAADAQAEADGVYTDEELTEAQVAARTAAEGAVVAAAAAAQAAHEAAVLAQQVVNSGELDEESEDEGRNDTTEDEEEVPTRAPPKQAEEPAAMRELAATEAAAEAEEAAPAPTSAAMRELLATEAAAEAEVINESDPAAMREMWATEAAAQAEQQARSTRMSVTQSVTEVVAGSALWRRITGRHRHGANKSVSVKQDGELGRDRATITYGTAMAVARQRQADHARIQAEVEYYEDNEWYAAGYLQPSGLTKETKVWRPPMPGARAAEAAAAVHASPQPPSEQYYVAPERNQWAGEAHTSRISSGRAAANQRARNPSPPPTRPPSSKPQPVQNPQRPQTPVIHPASTKRVPAYILQQPQAAISSSTASSGEGL